MDRRRAAAAKRPPPSSEGNPPTSRDARPYVYSPLTPESQYWSQAATSLAVLSSIQSDSATADTISNVNKWIARVPIPEQAGEAIEFGKIRGKLQAGLDAIKTAADTEAKCDLPIVSR